MRALLTHVPAIERIYTENSRNIHADRLQSLDWREVALPSNVQTSPFGMPLDELYQLDHVNKVMWMHEEYWLYRVPFRMPSVGRDEEAVLRLNGIDYKCKLFLNGSYLFDSEGMFHAVEIPLGGLELETDHEVLVVIEPFHEGEEPFEHMKARYSVGKGWDFAPAIRSIGIWDEAELIVRKKLRVAYVNVETKLANSQRADVAIHVDLSEKVDFGLITVELDGVKRTFPVVQADRAVIPLNVPSPTLWWPNGMGDARLIELKIDLAVEGRLTDPFVTRTGLRSLDRVACQGQAVEDIPLQLVVNNEPVFIKGVNWVPLDSCSATISKERYRLFLERFKEAGVNLIRVWGGGLKEKDSFYEIADELGLMVMQEFPLACQILAWTEKFYRLIHQEVTDIVNRLKKHPSIVIWSGGNEHYHYWDTVDSGTEIMEQSRSIVVDWFHIDEHSNREWAAYADKYDEPSLGLMGVICAVLDPSRPYQITSGMEGEGEVHGIWTWKPQGGDYRFRDYDSLYDFWLKANQHFYSEACVPSIANRETIEKVFDDSNPVYPHYDDPIWNLHNAFDKFFCKDSWLDMPSTEELFGPLPDLNDFIFANQWMQGEGARFFVEEIRRKMGRACGVVWWGVNEPWPGLAGNALIDYYGKPKLGWQFLANAYRETVLSLRYEHCVARSVKPELWISHDGRKPFRGTYMINLTHMFTGETETLTGAIACQGQGSQLIRLLPRTRLYSGRQLHASCKLFDESGNAVHENDYVFASNEDKVPMNAKVLSLLKRIYRNG